VLGKLASHTLLPLICVLSAPAFAATEEDAPEEAAAPQPPPATPPAAAPPAAAAAAQTPPPYPAHAAPPPFWGPPPQAAAPQADRAKPAEPQPPEEPEGLVIPRWQVVLGARTMFVTSPGFDPFSENNAMTEFSLGAGRTIFSDGILSVAAVAYYDASTRSSTARGERTELESHRLSLGPEARAHVMPELYAFARLSPAILRTSALLEEASSGTSLFARSFSFGFDAVGGVAFRAFSFGRGEKAARFWVIGEGGYGWAAETDLLLAPDEEDSAAPQRVGDLDLGTLDLRGPMFRVAVGLTF
jgi:hypothetical protein